MRAENAPEKIFSGVFFLFGFSGRTHIRGAKRIGAHNFSVRSSLGAQGLTWLGAQGLTWLGAQGLTWLGAQLPIVRPGAGMRPEHRRSAPRT